MRTASAVAACLTTMAISFSYPAVALTTDDDGQVRGIETTIFGGYRSGGSFRETKTISNADETAGNITRDVYLKESVGFGVAINWEAEPDSFYEVAYSRQTTTLRSTVPIDLRIEFLQIGGYATFLESKHKTPYLLITVGTARFSPETAGLDAVTKFAAAIGGGIKFPLTKHLALRFDARLYAAFFSTQANIFCSSTTETKCFQSIQSSTFLQPDASLGLTVRF